MSLAVRDGIDFGTTKLAVGVSSRHLDFEANITALTSIPTSLDGRSFAAGLGDGAVVVFGADGSAGPELNGHDAAVTGLAALGSTLFSAAQDGKLIAHDLVSGSSTILLSKPGRWIDSIAASPKSGCVATVVGKEVLIIPTEMSPRDAVDARFANHPSSVSGLAFSPDGQRIAVSHYNGVTMWPINGESDGETLKWKGYHIGVSWSPDSRFIVSATQERELHVWDLLEEKDFRLGGYPSKTHELAWTSPDAGPVKLACSGADVITAWPFGDVGPGRLPPVEIGYVYSGRVSTVSPHPNRPWVAGGYTTGTVLVGGLQKGEAAFARIADNQEITGLAWASDGSVLASGTRRGRVDLITVGELKVR